MNNKSKYLLVMTKEEHIALREGARKLDLSIKEFILLATYNLIENKPDIRSTNARV